MLTTPANTHSKSLCPSKRPSPYYASASLGAVSFPVCPLVIQLNSPLRRHLRGHWCAALELDQSALLRPRYTLSLILATPICSGEWGEGKHEQFDIFIPAI